MPSFANGNEIVRPANVELSNAAEVEYFPGPRDRAVSSLMIGSLAVVEIVKPLIFYLLGTKVCS